MGGPEMSWADRIAAAAVILRDALELKDLEAAQAA